MKEMYLINVLGNLSFAASVSVAIAVLTTFIFGVICLTDECTVETKKVFKISLVSAIICSVVAIFTPSQKSLYMIYGIGGAIDYIKNNEIAQQLPGKAITAIDMWVDSIIDDKDSKK